MENKEILIRNILRELEKIPTNYLQNLWHIIRTFRENIPMKDEKLENQFKEESTDRVWDDLIEDVNKQRQFSNQQMEQKLDSLFDFEEKK